MNYSYIILSAVKVIFSARNTKKFMMCLLNIMAIKVDKLLMLVFKYVMNCHLIIFIRIKILLVNILNFSIARKNAQILFDELEI